MNKDKKTYVEPNMKVLEVDTENLMAAISQGGSEEGGDAKGAISPDDDALQSNDAWKD